MNTSLMFSSATDEWETPLEFYKSLIMGFYRIGGGYNVFCNPPYGRVIGAWVEKAYKEAQKNNTLVVMLLPARTDTRWFHEFIYHTAEIRFIKGRLKFGGCKNAAPFPSMVVIFKKDS